MKRDKGSAKPPAVPRVEPSRRALTSAAVIGVNVSGSRKLRRGSSLKTTSAYTIPSSAVNTVTAASGSTRSNAVNAKYAFAWSTPGTSAKIALPMSTESFCEITPGRYGNSTNWGSDPSASALAYLSPNNPPWSALALRYKLYVVQGMYGGPRPV